MCKAFCKQQTFCGVKKRCGYCKTLSLKAISGISEKKGHIFGSRKVLSLNYTLIHNPHVILPVPFPTMFLYPFFGPQDCSPHKNHHSLGKGEGGDRKAGGKMEVSFAHGGISVRRSSFEGAGESFDSARNQLFPPPGEAHFIFSASQAVRQGSVQARMGSCP